MGAVWIYIYSKVSTVFGFFLLLMTDFCVSRISFISFAIYTRSYESLVELTRTYVIISTYDTLMNLGPDTLLLIE